MTDHVFGYGSLAAPSGGELAALGFRPSRARRREGFVADVRGARRGWGVAMDNRVDLPGYKCYVDRDGRRPPVFVCFLDIEHAPGERVNGLCLPVTATELAALDRRERNYERTDVTCELEAAPEPGTRVWAYRGSPAGRARFAEGIAAGTAVVQAGYLEAVRAAFAALGEAEWEACAPSLDPRGLPVRALQRRELA